MENKIDDKSHVIQLLNHIGDQEKHFNGLETQYRLLASTWLLACFGAMGFLLQTDKRLFIDTWVLTGTVGIIGSIGIYLLWLMDIKVYHKLLHCAFIEGIKLEQEYDWLPKIRTEMIIRAIGDGSIFILYGVKSLTLTRNICREEKWDLYFRW